MSERPSSDTWAQGSPYERYMGRWSRQVAPRFLSWLNVPGGQRWLDVGCGTGALCAAILDQCAPTSVTGVEPSEGFLNTAKSCLSGRATFQQGGATSIPLGNAAVDVVVSGLVLNFVPDQQAALFEMKRVASSGGTIAHYVWDYSGRMELLRHFWNLAAEFDADAAKLDEGVRFPICHPEALEKLFAAAGLEDVEVTAIDVPTLFGSFDDYWQPFMGGQGPAPTYAMSLGPTARARLRDGLRERLPISADGSISLTARAWAIRAITAP